MWIAAIIGAVAGGIGSSLSKTEASRARRKQRKLLAANMAFYQGIWDDYKTKYGGIEDKLISEAEKGLDYKRFAGIAQADIAGAYDRSREIGERRMAGFGLTPSGGGYEQNLRNVDIDEAKSIVGARNRARQYVTGENFRRRQQVLNFGAGLRNAAMGGISASNLNLANLYGAEAARSGAAADAYAQGAIGNLGTAIGAMSTGTEAPAGGTQPISDQQTQGSRNYLQGWQGFNNKKDWMGQYYGGDSGVKHYAEGGLVEGIVERVAGFLPPRNVDKTVEMQNRYRQYNIEAQTTGQPVASWGDWVTAQGYQLDSGDQVQEMPAQTVEPIQQYACGGKVDGKHKYADGGAVSQGLTPRNMAYADGGQVTGPPGVDKVPAVVDGKKPARLTSGEYVMSHDAVMHHGLKRLDAMNTEGKEAAMGAT